MRADFGSKEKQKEFFKKVKENRTWKQLYELMIDKLDNPSFRTFQNWYKGNYLPELNVVKVICDLTHQTFDKLDIRLRDERWGQSKGGKRKIQIYGCNLTIEDRIRGVLSHKSKVENEISDKIKNFKITEDFCELYGILMGDGCISTYLVKDGGQIRRRFETTITGNINERNYYCYYVLLLIQRALGKNARTYPHYSSKAVVIRIRVKFVFELVKSFGFPVGHKNPNLIIPQKLLGLPDRYLRRLVRGLTDTDGCIFAKKREGYRYPHVKIKSHSPKLREQLKELLKRLGFTPHYSDAGRTSICIRGIKNVEKFEKEIGFANLKHVMKYLYWKKQGVLPPMAFINNLSMNSPNLDWWAGRSAWK